MKVGIFGASGYAGAELMRICFGHPAFEVAFAGASTYAGQFVGDLYPSLATAYPAVRYQQSDPAAADGLDVAFLALPHGMSQELAGQLRRRVGAIVDLSGDFRLSDPSLYPIWYGLEHSDPELLAEFAYGLPELFRPTLRKSRLVAVPGCYPTAAALALAPLVRAGAIEKSGVVVDAASGVSGAGRSVSHATQFGSANEDFSAYGLLNHRHTPEIEQAIGAEVLFTPHLAPMSRGILATCYARPSASTSTDELLSIMSAAYSQEPFVSVINSAPSTKSTYGSNAAHVTVRHDERTRWVVALCALDNLVKGAAGQAVQCANLVMDLPEADGLSAVGLFP